MGVTTHDSDDFMRMRLRYPAASDVDGVDVEGVSPKRVRDFVLSLKGECRFFMMYRPVGQPQVEFAGSHRRQSRRIDTRYPARRNG